MRTILILLAWVAVATSPAFSTTTEQEKWLAEAVALRQQGRYAEAEARLQQLVNARPDQPYWRQMLAEVRAERETVERDVGRRLRGQLRAVRLPEINLRDAAAREAVATVLRQAGELSRHRQEINYVWLVPATARLRTVTVALRDIPLEQALDYITEPAGLRYRVEAHAVVFYLPAPPPAPAAHVQPD